MVHKNLRWGGLLPLLFIMAFAVIACVADDGDSPKKQGTISYTTTAVEKTVGDETFIIPLTKTGDGAVTYTSSDTKVATVEAKSGLVTIVGIGSTTITATIKDSSEYTYATKTASYTLTVKEAVPEKKAGNIAFTTTEIEKTISDSTFIIPLTKTGDGVVTYTSSDIKVATVHAETGEVTIAGIGSTTITATVKDSSEYTYATKTASYTLTVKEAVPEKKAGNIAFATTEIEKTIGDSTFINPLTKEGDGVVTYTSSDIKVAVVDGATGTVVLTGNAGTTTITATVADSATYAYATKTASYTLTVKKLAGTISFARTTLEISVNETSFTNALTKTGDGTVTYTSSDTNVATVHAESGEVTIKGLAGNTTITATVADSDKYTYSTKTATYTLTVSQSASGRKKGSITYAAVELEKAIDEAAFTNPLTMTGDGTVTYTSTNTNVATVDAATGVVTMIAEGNTTIIATVADSAEYTYQNKAAAYTLKVTKSASGKQPGSISWEVAEVGKTTIDTKFTNTLTNTGDGQVFYMSSDTTIASVDARTGEVKILGVAGTTTITATVEDGTGFYYTVKTLSYVLTVSKAAGTIGYGTSTVEKMVDDSAFTNKLTKTGDGKVTYSSSNTNVATVNASSGEVTIVADGSAVITATVEDGSKYTYATKTASYTLTVNKYSGSIRFNEASVEKTRALYKYTKTVTKTGDGVVKYSSGNTEVATVDEDSGVVTILAEGSTTITATVTDSNTYSYEIKTASYTLTITAATEEDKNYIDFVGGYIVIDKLATDPPFTPDFINTGDGKVRFTASNSRFLTVDPDTGMITIVAGGYIHDYSTVIDAEVVELRNDYYSDRYASCCVCVSKVGASINYSQTTIDKTTEDGKFTNPLTNTGDGTASYSSSNTDVATVDPVTGEITIVGNTGSTIITANIADGPKYKYPEHRNWDASGPNGEAVYEPMTATYTLAVRRPAGISYAVTAINKISDEPAFTNPLENTGDGTVKYTSSNTTVAEVNSSTGEVRITGGGDVTITATVSDSDNSTYSTKTVSYSLHVEWADAPVKSKPDAIGDIVLNDGTAVAAGNVLSPSQRAMAVAVIFYVPDDTEDEWNRLNKMLGISLKKSGFLQWCSEEAEALETKLIPRLYFSNGRKEGLRTGATAWQDVKDAVSDWDISGRYPAWEWVNNYASANGLTGNWASGWYLPAQKELEKLGKPVGSEKTFDIINRSLSVCGGDPFVEAEHYISCNTITTVVDNTYNEHKKIWHYIIGSGYTVYYKATIQSHVADFVYFGVRAVRAFDVE